MLKVQGAAWPKAQRQEGDMSFKKQPAVLAGTGGKRALEKRAGRAEGMQESGMRAA